MTLTILAITGFQLYWLKQAYNREERTLEIRTNMAFRETIHALQAAKLQVNELANDSGVIIETRGRSTVRFKARSDEKLARMMNVLRDAVKDSARIDKLFLLKNRAPDTGRHSFQLRNRKRIVEFLYDMESLQDSINLREIDSAYTLRLEQQSINVPFEISKLEKPSEREERIYNEVTLGFKNPVTYRLKISDTFVYVMQRISAPLLLSLFLVAFTIVSFALLYRNLLRQQRLGDLKNDFISNITHELKTPIATVSVAIEALRNFSAGMDAQKTREYLDISANELQRLSLLVDKVLKLSMFEKREVDLKYEPLDMKALVEEVTNSMKLQAEKQRAVITLTTEGDTLLEGDRLHLVSVIFNLVDNALKYSYQVPEITIAIIGSAARIVLKIADNGIGVPPEYKEKIFEKFFRVPTGNLHNAKGYGLGLSYVAHVVAKHKGTIHVESEGTGCQFIISLPKHKID
ncbi:MAG: HAMP domain-containing sensor histidine kinase [Chitinophagaceae bacterium]